MKIDKTKEVWVVSTNTDLTEGRGFNYPIHVCEKEATAIRLSKRKYIQGSDAPIHKSIAVFVNGDWLAPCKIEVSNAYDDKVQALLDAKSMATKKAKEAGLTEEEIELLKL